MQYVIFRFVIMGLLGLMIFSCEDPDANKNNNVSGPPEDINQEGKTDENPTKPATDALAFDEIVKVLHAPYTNGDYFFKLLPDKMKTVAENKNSDFTVGNGKNLGAGTYPVKVIMKQEQQKMVKQVAERKLVVLVLGRVLVLCYSFVQKLLIL